MIFGNFPKTAPHLAEWSRIDSFGKKGRQSCNVVSPQCVTCTCSVNTVKLFQVKKEFKGSGVEDVKVTGLR